MNRIDLPHLVWALESLVDGHVVNPIEVDPQVAALGPGRPRPDARAARCRSSSQGLARHRRGDARSRPPSRRSHGKAGSGALCHHPSMWHPRPARSVVLVVGTWWLLAACAHSAQTDLSSIRAEVSSLPDPAQWVRGGGVQYECESLNLDCTNSSSGLTWRRSSSTGDACAALVTWINSVSAFVGPVGGVHLTTWRTPTTEDCTSEVTTRGRYLIKAAGRSSVSTSPGLGWQVLMTREATGPRLSVILGDPPEPLANLGT